MNGEAWWKALNGNEDNCAKAILVLKDFYIENPLRKQENPYSQSPVFILDSTRRRGEDIDIRSTNGTPRTDSATQSPRGKVSSVDEAAAEREIDAAAAESASQAAPGDSDVVLKEAANNPGTHPGTNGTKRKEVESLAPESRDPKRQRLSSDDDEGEVYE